MKLPAGKQELAASRDEARPTLTHLWVRRELAPNGEANGAGHLYATDSYVAVKVPVELEPDDTDGWITRDALIGARKPSNKAFRSAPATLELNGSQVFGNGATLPRPAADAMADPPPIDQLIPDVDTLEPTFEIGLNAELLFRVQQAIGADTVRIRFTDALKPAIVTKLAGEGPNGAIGLVMPVRLEGTVRP